MAESRISSETFGKQLLIGASILALGAEVIPPVLALTGVGDIFAGLDFVLRFALAILLRLAVLILLFVEVFRGRNWARWVLGLLYLASAALRLVPAEGASFGQLGVSDLVTLWIYLLLGLLLLAGKPIRAYQAAERAKADR